TPTVAQAFTGPARPARSQEMSRSTMGSATTRAHVQEAEARLVRNLVFSEDSNRATPVMAFHRPTRLGSGTSQDRLAVHSGTAGPTPMARLIRPARHLHISSSLAMSSITTTPRT